MVRRHSAVPMSRFHGMPDRITIIPRQAITHIATRTAMPRRSSGDGVPADGQARRAAVANTTATAMQRVSLRFAVAHVNLQDFARAANHDRR